MAHQINSNSVKFKINGHAPREHFEIRDCSNGAVTEICFDDAGVMTCEERVYQIQDFVHSKLEDGGLFGSGRLEKMKMVIDILWEVAGYLGIYNSKYDKAQLTISMLPTAEAYKINSYINDSDNIAVIRYPDNVREEVSVKIAEIEDIIKKHEEV